MYRFHNGITVIFDHVAWINSQRNGKPVLIIGYGATEAKTGIEFSNVYELDAARADFESKLLDWVR
jgi:hypothetical protein